MDPDGAVSRVERTFWTVWNYVTEAVNRFLRPEPSNVVSNDQSSLQEPSEAADCSLAEGDTCKGGIDEEQSLVAVPEPGSSRPIVAWEVCTTDSNEGPDGGTLGHKTPLVRSSEGKAVEEGEGKWEEQFTQPGRNVAGMLLENDEEEQHKDGKLDICGLVETPENDECEKNNANPVSLNLTDAAVSEDLEETRRIADAEEEARAPLDDQPKTAKAIRNIQVKEEDSEMQHEADHDFQWSYTSCSLEAEDAVVRSCTVTDLSIGEVENVDIEESRVQRTRADTTTPLDQVDSSGGALQLASDNENNLTSSETLEPRARQATNQSVYVDLSDDFKGDAAALDIESLLASSKSGIVSEGEQLIAGQEEVTPYRCEGTANDTAEDKEERVDDVPCSNVIQEDAAMYSPEQTDEMSAREDDIETTEGNQEEGIQTSEDVAQIPTADKHTAAITDDKQEDVTDVPDVQTKHREEDVEMKSHGTVMDEESNMIDVPEEGDEDKEKAEGLSGVGENKEGYMEIASTAAIEIKHEVENGQEVSGEYKNSLLGIYEVVAVNTCEETQEPVPEYNNEPGRDENTRQGFLEVGDYEEIQTTQLPKEVESKEENFPNSSSGAECFLEEEHDSRLANTDDSQNMLDASTEDGIRSFTDAEPPPVIQESGSACVREAGESSESSMETGIGLSEKELDTPDSFAEDEPEDPQDETEELLVEFIKDQGVCDSRDTEAADVAAEDVAGFIVGTSHDDELQRTTETPFCDDLIDVITSEQNSSGASSLEEDITERQSWKQSVESEQQPLKEYSVEMQDIGIEMEEEGCGFEEVAGDETLRLLAMTSELPTHTDREGDGLIAGSELTAHITSEPQGKWLETNVQVSVEISNEEMLNETVAAEDEVSTGDMAKLESHVGHAVETGSAISGRQDVIDEDILDLWLQTASSEETFGGKQQEGFESGQQMDPEIPSLTAEPGFLDLSFGGWGEQNSETPQRISTITEGANAGDQLVDINVSEIIEADLEPCRSDSEVLIAVGIMSTDSSSLGETCLESEQRSWDKPHAGWSKQITEIPEVDEAEEAEQEKTASDDQIQVDGFALDFAAQKSRIAVKNPRIRPPKDPRSLLHMPSVEPICSTHLPSKVPAGVPLAGLGIGIKLPGLGAGFPVLKKVQRVARDENNPENSRQEPETNPKEEGHTPKQDEVTHKPKWMTPRQPGFGSPLMSELKTKLKKTPKE